MDLQMYVNNELLVKQKIRDIQNNDSPETTETADISGP